jgi:hypothetical protein
MKPSLIFVGGTFLEICPIKRLRQVVWRIDDKQIHHLARKQGKDVE